MGPTAPSGLQETNGKRRNRIGQRSVCLRRPLPLGVVPQDDCRVIAEPLSDGMNRDAGIKQRGPVVASQIMKSRLAEAEQTGAPSGQRA
jgi:hypothetical protein